MSRICLNMIVKNESRIIRRFLESVSKHITTFCICDTGSTDDTIEIITKYFSEINMKGTIIEIPFQNFEYNRTMALNACQFMDNVDYILLLDADMILLCKSLLSNFLQDKKDIYYIIQGVSSFTYKNVRLIKTNQSNSCIYKGVTHEYLHHAADNQSVFTIDKEDVFIFDIGDGGCKEDKMIRDITLLENSLLVDPTNARTLFYLARTYYEIGNYEKAISIFEIQNKYDKWIEEKWYGLYCQGKCYYALDKKENALLCWINAYILFPNRIENLYYIVRHYRQCEEYDLAYYYYELATSEMLPENKNFLFNEDDIYDYHLHYEFSIIGYYCNPKNRNLLDLNMTILSRTSLYNSIIFQNYKFYATNISLLNDIILFNNDDDELNTLKCIINIHESPLYFSLLRGSTNGVIIDDKIWYICHMSDDDRLYHYYIITVLDKKTNIIVSCSHFFTLNGYNDVEYTLGMKYSPDKDVFLISARSSLITDDTKFISIPKKDFENRVFPVEYFAFKEQYIYNII